MPSKLAAKIRAKFPGVYDALDDATLERQVIAKYPQYADLAEPDTSPSSTPGLLARSGRFIRAHPTEIGATLGAMAAVPFTGGASLLPAIAAAGLGGAGGAGLGMLAGAAGGSPDIPTTPRGVVQTMGTQGATQALSEGAGRLITGGLGAVARRLYQSSLKPTLAAREQYPTLVRMGLKEGIPVSHGGEATVSRLRSTSKAAADELVRTTGAAPGAPVIDPTDAVAGIMTAVKNVHGLPVARPTMRAIGDYGRAYLAEHLGPLSLSKAQQAVRATDRFFNSAYRATIDRSNPVTAGATAAAMGINDETRALLRKAVPGLKEQNARTQALMGLQKSIARRMEQVANTSPLGMQHLLNLGVGGTVGYSTDSRQSGIEAFLAAEALTNPAVASRLAIGLARGSRLPAAHALRAAYLSQLAREHDQ